VAAVTVLDQCIIWFDSEEIQQYSFSFLKMRKEHLRDIANSVAPWIPTFARVIL